MAELSLRERLQPSLLDRLLDDERLLTIYELAVEREELQRLGVSARDLQEIVAAQGLTPVSSEAAGAQHAPQDRAVTSAAVADSTGHPHRESSLLHLTFSAANGRVGLSRLKSLILKPPGAPQGITLQSFCRIDARNVLNDAAEPPERRYLSQRRLRESVCRDLAILLNSSSLDFSIDLSLLPHVRRSVLNYGMPSLAGRATASVELQQIARTVEEIIRQFEPRLVQVRVVPETERAAHEEHEIALRIDAELWGQPMPQHLVLRTRICTESGDVKVTDSGA